jgi:acyl-CoA thioesterase FadM
VLLETNIAYKKQLVLGQRPYLEVGIAELGRAGALMTMVIFHEDGQVAAEATQRGMFCTYPELRPYRIPPEIRQRFEQFVAVAPR